MRQQLTNTSVNKKRRVQASKIILHVGTCNPSKIYSMATYKVSRTKNESNQYVKITVRSFAEPLHDDFCFSYTLLYNGLHRV